MKLVCGLLMRLHHLHNVFCINQVTMQAQRAALVDMVCKDKFLIQSTVVPVGTTNDDITSSLVWTCLRS